MQCFTLTQQDHVAHLVLSRPDAMNTMHPLFWRELDDVLTSLHREGQARALVISSTGKHFSAGMSLETFSGANLMNDKSPEGRAAMFDMITEMQSTFSKLESLRMPVIAAIQGGCIGGALDLAAACDLRVCSADAFFTVQEIHIGMAADLGVLQRLPKLVPPAVAREMAYTGEKVDADRALAIGLVNAVWPNAEVLHAQALELAHKIAAKSPLAIAGSKLALNHARDHGTAESLAQMTLLQSAIFDTGEMATAIAAWKAKAPADFAPLGPVPEV
jgi:enoyl-CoA hydratase